MIRFYSRFNLHQCAESLPVCANIMANLLKREEKEVQAYLDEFESVQTQRVDVLRNKIGLKPKQMSSRKVLFFGDSITSDNLGYRTTVTKLLGLEAHDCSVSGSTTAAMIQQAEKHRGKFSDKTVSIMIGTNDSIMIGKERFQQVSLSEYHRNVSALVRWAKEEGAKILLFEIPPVHEARFKEHYPADKKMQSNENIAKYNDVLRKIANEYDIPLYSNQWLLSDLDLYYEPDGVHLSKEAHDVFTEKWLVAATT